MENLLIVNTVLLMLIANKLGVFADIKFGHMVALAAAGGLVWTGYHVFDWWGGCIGAILGFSIISWVEDAPNRKQKQREALIMAHMSAEEWRAWELSDKVVYPSFLRERMEADGSWNKLYK